MLVGFNDFLKVSVADRPLADRVFLLQPSLQNLRSRLQINYQVRRRQLLAEKVVVAVVSLKFLIAQIEAGEEFVLLKDEIRHDGFLRRRARLEKAQLFEPPN